MLFEFLVHNTRTGKGDCVENKFVGEVRFFYQPVSHEGSQTASLAVPGDKQRNFYAVGDGTQEVFQLLTSLIIGSFQKGIKAFHSTFRYHIIRLSVMELPE